MADNLNEVPIPDDLIDTREAAKVAGCVHLSTLHRWIKSGKLRAWKRAGSRFRVSRQDVLDLLAPVELEPNVQPIMTKRQLARRAAADMAECRRRGLA